MPLIDLSLTISPNNSEPVPVEIDYISHEVGGDMLGAPAGIDHHAFPDQMGLSIEFVKISTHTGTHVDAPLHYGPYSEGKKSLSIAELPLDWFYSTGVLFRLQSNPELGDVGLEECKDYLSKIGYNIKPFDIVLFELNGDKHWGNQEYFTSFRGISPEVTEWLINLGVKVIGVDTFGFDPPFDIMLDRYKKTQNQSYLWPAHILGRKKTYCQIERLCNLSKIPSLFGFRIICFPIKIEKCGAAWSRVVAEV